MRKRKREVLEEEPSSEATVATVTLEPCKKAKQGKDSFGELTSLLSSEDSLVAGLTYFLTTIKHEVVSGNTASLLEMYLQRFPDCEHILTPLDWSKEKKSVDVMLLCFESLEQILLFTAAQSKNTTPSASDNVHHSIGTRLVHTLLSNHMKSVYSSLLTYLPMRLIRSCLRVLAAMVMQGPGAARDVQQVFNFAYKPLEVFPSRTYIIQGRSDSVRLCFMNFALSFLIVGESDVKKSILELKGFLSSLFKLLPNDPSDTILIFLNTLSQKVVSDTSIPKKTKSSFFKVYILKQISGFLSVPSDHTHSSGSPTDLELCVHDFLVKLCTNFQLGICYRRKELPHGLEITTNPVILNFLLSLTGSLPRLLVQTLVLSALTTCPDLILSYLRSLPVFDPQPNSKWITSVGFIIKLFTVLPSLSTLILDDDDKDRGCHRNRQPSLSYLDVGVGLTIPVVATRSGLSLGLQHPLPILKYQTLGLMKIALVRAAGLVGVWAEVKRSVGSIHSFLVAYCDSVLKCLPDIKTMISLHQQLLAASGGVVKGCGQTIDESSLDPSDRLRNAELQESPDLLSLSLEVMRGYQTLFPAIFVQADYNLAKLLPGPRMLATSGQRSSGSVEHYLEPTVLVTLLQLLTEAPSSGVKWLQKGSSTLSSILWLILNSSTDVSNRAFTLALKLLVSVEILRVYSCDISIILLTLRECHAPSLEDNEVLVNFVTKVLLTAVKDESKVHSETKTVLSQSYSSLKDILAAPLKIPEVSDPCDSHMTHNHDNSEPESDEVSPLIHSLLSLALPDNSPLEKKFTINSIRKLLLVANSDESASFVGRHLGPILESERRPVLGEENQFFLSVLSSCIRYEERGDGSCSSVFVNEVEDRVCISETFQLVCASDEEFRCSVRALLTLLWRLWKSGQDSRMCDVGFLFDLLLEAVAKMATSSERSSVVKSTSTDNNDYKLVLCEIFESRLIREASLPQQEPSITHDPLLTPMSKTKTRRKSKDKSSLSKRRRNTNYTLLFNERIGELVSVGVGHFPELKTSRSIKFTVEQLFNYLSYFFKNACLEEEIIGGVLTDLVRDLRVCIDSKMAAEFINCLFLSYKDIVSTQNCIDVLATILDLLIKPVSSARQTEDRESEDFPASEVGLYISGKALENLVKFAMKATYGELNSVIYSLLKEKLDPPAVSGTEVAPKTQDSGDSVGTVSENDEEEDAFVSSLNSLATSLWSTQIVDRHQNSSSELTPAITPPASFPTVVGASQETKHTLVSPGQAVTKSDSFIADKVDEIFLRLHDSCFHHSRAKALIESSQTFSHSSNLASRKLRSTNTPLLSDRSVTKLLKHCIQNPSPFSDKIAALLFGISELSCKYFESTLLSEVCECLDSHDSSSLETKQLYQLEMIATYVAHLLGKGGDKLETVEDKEAFKMVCKRVWVACSGIITDTTSHKKDIVAVCSTILHSLTSLLPKGVRKLQKLLLKWDKTPTCWRRHQLSLALSVQPDSLTNHSLPSIVVRRVIQTLEILFQERKCDEERRLLESAISFVKTYIQHCLSASVVAVASDMQATELMRFFHTALKQSFSSPLVLRLLAQLVKLFCMPTDISSGCGLQGSKADHTKLLESLYERVWSHSKFLPVMCLSHDYEDKECADSDQNELKECLIELLVSMVEQRPSLGNSSHVPVLLSAYSATKCRSDRGLLYLLFQYEVGGVSMGKYRPFLWGPAALEHYKQKQEVGWLLWKQPGMQEVIGQLKRNLLLESTKHFPINTTLNPENPFSVTDSNTRCGSDGEVGVYDPCFLLPLLTQQLDPSCLVDCRQFVDSGCLGYLIVCLSSTVEGVRSVSGRGLSLFSTHLEGSRFREKAQVSLLLEVLKNTIKEKDCRLPSIFTAFAAKTASLLLHAESPLYAVVSRFLVYKPMLDLDEMPLFTIMLHSSSVEHNKERMWMLQLLLSGLRCKEDYSLYRRKRVFDHLLALCDTGVVGNRCQSLILELVYRSVAIPEVAIDLVASKGLMTSLEHILSAVRTR